MLNTIRILLCPLVLLVPKYASYVKGTDGTKKC
jgi:hypothetical protein